MTTASTKIEGGRPIGQVLLESGLITAEQLAAALDEQRRQGGRLGTHLILQGAVTRLQLYSRIADQMGMSFVNLTDTPPDPDLMAKVDPKTLVDRDWIPHHWDGNTLVIATSESPTRRAINQAAAEYGEGVADLDIDIVITTDWDLDQAVTMFCRERLLFNAAEELATYNPQQSAKGKPVPWQRATTYAGGAILLAALILRPSLTVVAILIFLNITFFLAILFKVVTTLIGLVRMRETNIVRRELREMGLRVGREFPERDLPIYTILVPVFHEANVVDKVLEHLGELDWPKSKLQVLILCEEVDSETIDAVKASRPPEFVRLLVVPKGTPQTKPRACNFGLMFALGDYLVIYDAEDRPEPDQLRNSHAAFLHDRQSADQSHPLACVQAALNYFNWDTNLLTRLFTLEYSSWFDGMLYGMEFFKLPIPLGGTSNHFRTDRLRQMGGWDPYNVTEDADLGMRASAAGFRVGTIESTTWEEAASKIVAFTKQRTRWIKGYMVTTLVDLRYPVKFVRSAGLRSLFTLIGLIAGTPFMFLAYPVVWAITLVVLLGFETFAFSLPEWVGQFATINAIGGNIAILGMSMITGAVRHGWRISGYSLLNPIYWCLHATAAWRALWQLFFNPFHWEKTPHGLQHGHEEVKAVS